MPEIISGNLRGPGELSLERAIDAAKLIYLARGYLPIHTYADLIDRGCILAELEVSWDAEPNL